MTIMKKLLITIAFLAITCVLCFSCRENTSRECIEIVGFYSKDDGFIDNTLRYALDTFTTQMLDTNSLNVVKFGYGILAEFMQDRLKEPKHSIDSLNRMNVYEKEEFIWRVFKANPHIADSINWRLVTIFDIRFDKFVKEKVSNNPDIIKLNRELDSITQTIKRREDSVFRARTKIVW